MKYILSWGGGVNSTAILAMMRLGMLPELTPENTTIVFADTGAEMPYTYEHTTTCRFWHEFKWVLLNPYDERYVQFYSNRCKGKSLGAYCIEKQCMPSRINRWCTVEWKSNPIRKYRESICSNPKMWKEEVRMILGIAVDEIKRAKFLGMEHTYYPLIEQNISRERCFELIKQADLPIARKSGCYFCPYQSKSQWLELYKDFPKLFEEAEKIENIAQERYKGKGYYLRGEMPIRKQIEKWLDMAKKKQAKECEQDDLFERHCLCEL